VPTRESTDCAKGRPSTLPDDSTKRGEVARSFSDMGREQIVAAKQKAGQRGTQ